MKAKADLKNVLDELADSVVFPKDYMIDEGNGFIPFKESETYKNNFS